MTTPDAIETEHSGDWLESIGNRWGRLTAGADDATPDGAGPSTRSAATTLGAAKGNEDVGRQVRADIEDDLAAERVEQGTSSNDPGVLAWYARFDALQELAGNRWAWGDHLADAPADAALYTEMHGHLITTLGMTPEEAKRARSSDIRAKVAEVSARNLEAENRALRAGAGRGTGAKGAKPAGRQVAIPADATEINRQFRLAVENDDRAAIARLSGPVERLSRRGGYLIDHQGQIADEIFF